MRLVAPASSVRVPESAAIMLSSLETGLGLDIVIWLQAHSPPPLPALAQVLHYAGGTVVYILLMALIVWAVNYRLGIRLLLTLVGSIALTEGLKTLFARPRPFQVAPDRVMPLVAQGGYGLPSGHVLQAVAVLGTLAWTLHDRRWQLFAVLYACLMAWGRMATGVHYPQDVLLGALVGGLWAAIVIRYGHRALAGWRRLPVAAQIGVIALAGLILMIALQADSNGAALSGALVGGALGLLWEARYVRFAAGGSLGRRALRVGLGLGLLLSAYLVLSRVFAPLPASTLWRAMRYALLAAIGLAGWPWFCVRLKLAERRTRTEGELLSDQI